MTSSNAPPADTVLSGKFKGEAYTAIIVEAEGLSTGGRIRSGDEIFSSLSAAVKAITGHPING
jgi:hypothetical protein